MPGSRNRQSLDGTWSFRHEDGPWRDAVVPMPWQAQFADLRQSSGRAVYRRSFTLPALDGRQAVLRFGAVSYFAEVRLNGRVIGNHEGGYLPFDCVIPADLVRGQNILEVHCLLPDGDPATSPDAPFAEIPHGKQSWYGPIGGIWQSVTVEIRDPAHLEHCAVRADLADGRVSLTLTLAQGAIGAGIQVHVLDPEGKTAAALTQTVTSPQETLAWMVSDVLAWSPDAPQLYRVQIDLIRDGVSVDHTTHSFGFRSITTQNGQILLNGKPFYLRGALDQDYYPETICTPPSVAFLEDQLHKAKALGLNLLRCHIKVPDPRYYEVADRLGMLIWTEIPNVASFTAASARRMKETMQGILERDGNHPSIVIWSLINEDWGTRVIEDASHRAWLAGLYDWLKQADPSRLVVDNSPCHQNFHVKTDINDFHYYRSVPERRAEWDQLTREFAGAADWTWSPHGDAQRKGDEPLVVSEFGVWGLPNPAEVAAPDGSEPWWMETGSAWGDGVAYPHGVQIRFATYRLDTVFGSFDAFIKAAQWYQFANLKYQIESLRARPSIMGYVITEFTDVHWESNGLLDMNRNPRIFHNQFATINTDIVIVPRVAQYSGYAGQIFTFGLSVAFGGKDFSGGELEWAIGSQKVGMTLGSGQALSVLECGDVRLSLPAQAGMAEITLQLTVGGKVLARNTIPISVFAQRTMAGLPSIATDDPALAQFAVGLGYEVLAKADVTLAHGLKAADIVAMQSGARYLVLADGTAPLKGNLRLDSPPHMLLPDIGLVERDGTIWRGDWIAGFSWIRRSGAFAALPGGPLIDLSYDRVVPHHVMTGFRNWEYGGAVLSGLVAGWIHKPAALIAERRVGKGNLLASTYRLLTDPPGKDPVAAALFDALVATAAKLTVEA